MIFPSKDNKKIPLGLIGFLTIIINITNSPNLDLFSITSGSKTLAQVTPDNTLGTENSVVNPNVESQKLLIEGGATRERNLFHSFENFNVDERQNVYFANPAGIDLILSRVTGELPSNILGKLGVEGSADLFLLNPNGIFFGSNASLDINGSFLATTASSILFEDGTQFSATDPSIPPLLTVNVPIGLQFGNRAESIVNQSVAIGSSGFIEGLKIADDKTLTLVGGDILVEGGIFFGSGGSIELASIAANDRVGLAKTEKGWALNYKHTQNFQDIRFERVGFLIFSDGEIKLQGRRIAIQDGSQIGINPNLEIVINAHESVEVSGSNDSFGFPLFSGLFTASSDDKDAGNITINTSKLIVAEGGSLKTEVSGTATDGKLVSIGSGQAGNIVINADEGVEIADDGSGLFASSSGFGDAGNIRINSPQLIVRDGAQISTESTGEDPLGEELISTGKGGNIDILNAELVELTNGSSISAKTQGLGDDAGDINLNTNNLIVRDGSYINVSAISNSAAGNLNISANKIELDNGQLIANTVVGTRGNIVITTDNLLLSNQSSIGTNAESTDGGNITITTDNLVAVNNSDITANARQGIGGRVEINARGIFGIEAREDVTSASDITASSELGVQFSGEIIINTPEVDPTSGLIELPDLPVDAEALITQNPCALKNGRIADGSSFIVVGRGGLPPNADAPVINQNRIVDWASSTEVSREGIETRDKKALLNQDRISPPQPFNEERRIKIPPKIQQAQGLVKTEDGRIFLTANAPMIIFPTKAIAYSYCQN